MKKIKKPDIYFRFKTYRNDKYYFDEINNLYYVENYSKTDNVYFNDEGYIHNINNYASYYHNLKNFFINGRIYEETHFAEETNHLICKFCKIFCKQECF